MPGAPAHTLGPFSALHRLSKPDGRTREAALIRRVRAELTAQVGGRPTFAQKILIERAAVLTLRLMQIDRKIFAEGVDLTEIDNASAVSWQNALTRVLAALGAATAAAQTPPDPLEQLHAHLRRRAGETA